MESLANVHQYGGLVPDADGVVKVARPRCRRLLDAGEWSKPCVPAVTK